jgi:hypothetical protein
LTAFFERRTAVDLYLPDGWYGGRPMDGQHELTLVLERPARLLIELDEHILLTFTGEDVSVAPVSTTVLDRAGTPAIQIGSFRQLVVDARLYGSQETTAKIYSTGTVLLVSAR